MASPAAATPTSPKERASVRWPQLRETSDVVERALKMMDSAVKVPGTDFRVGLDPILGLLAPGAGDALSGAISLAVVFLGAQYRLPLHALSAMVANILLDTLVGSIPLLGDIFDLTFRANDRNLALLNRYREAGPATARRRFSPLTYWLSIVVMVVFALGILLLPFLVVAGLATLLF